MKLALVSDTHLAPRAAAFNANWQSAQTWIDASGADAVIHLGDISADGDDDPASLEFAAALLSRSAIRVHALPGNHDLGDNGRDAAAAEAHSINGARLQRYREHFGADRLSLATPHWLLLGINAQLLGTGMDEEHVQFAWIEEQLRAHAEKQIGLMLHKPLRPLAPGELDESERYVPPAARQRLLDLLRTRALRFIVSGHTHQWRRQRLDDIEHVWVPSTSFCIPDAIQPRLGEKIVGLMQLTLKDAEYRFDTIIPDAMRRCNLLDQLDIYPQLAGIKQRLGAEGEL